MLPMFAPIQARTLATQWQCHMAAVNSVAKNVSTRFYFPRLQFLVFYALPYSRMDFTIRVMFSGAMLT